jgi:quercetin dioxygenase-like cupin family protein
MILTLLPLCGFADEKPGEIQGVSGKLLVNHPLQEQIGALADYNMRARHATVAPGGQMIEHNHEHHPGFVYVLSGSVTEHRGDQVREISAGEYFLEDGKTIHWIENTSDEPASIVAIDIIPSPQKQ